MQKGGVINVEKCEGRDINQCGLGLDSLLQLQFRFGSSVNLEVLVI